MKYSELESRGDVKPELLFEETAKALLAEGVYLRKRGGPGVSPSLRAELLFSLLVSSLSIMFLCNQQVAPESRNPLLNMKLTDMLAEQQRDTETIVPEKEPQAETVNPDGQTSS